jgi:phage terminase large subunit
MFQKTTAQAKIATLRKRVRIVQGGTSSSKTYSILPLLWTYAANTPRAEISVVSESIPHLRRGAMRDFIKILQETGNYRDDCWNRSSLTYTLNNGSFIEFFSADQSDKLRGARRDVLFVNEANNVDWAAYHQMAIRTRKFIYIDYNPSAEFWAHTELMDSPDSDFIILTYKDNEALEPAIIKEIESAKHKGETSSYWANWWKVYGLGQVGSLQGVVYDNWTQVDSMPERPKWRVLGLDFGFTNDPTAAVEVSFFDGCIWVDEVLYETGLTSSDISDRLDKLKRVETIADAADPKTIEELRRRGHNIRACQKGADSIRAGIDLIQGYGLRITKRSINLVKELRGYTWDTDKTGQRLNKPIDRLNHGLDALRYAVMTKLRRTGKYDIR